MVTLIRIFFLITLMNFSFQACKEKEGEEVAEISDKTKPDTIYQIYFVNVDNLRVRQAPNLESRVLDKIKEGTLVYSQNKFSDRQETVTLRGKKTTAPYFFVEGEGFEEGWVYGGALVKIYQNSVPGPFTTRLQEVVAKMRNLNYADFETGLKLFSLISEYKGKDPVWNDAIYVTGKHFFDQLPAHIPFDENQRPMVSDEDAKLIFEGKYDMRQSSYTSLLENNGYKLIASEGDINVVRNETGLSKTIGGPFSSIMQAHLDLSEKFENNRIADDESIIIDLKQIVDMAIAEEVFSATYPDFIYKQEHLERKDFLEYILINGMGNSQVISLETKKANKTFLDAWNYARQKYPESDLVDKLNKIDL